MTGFGAASGLVGAWAVTVELRSVNHRFFNASVRLPAEFARWESEVRDAMRTRVSRGHVTLAVRLEHAAQEAALIDVERFGRFVAALRELRDRFGLAGDLDVATILRLPDVVRSPDSGDVATPTEFLALVHRALDALQAARESEGGRLGTYLNERLDQLESGLGRLAVRAPQRVVQQRDKLRLAIAELTQGIALDESRLAQEVAVLAERLDVQEEMARFHAHVAAFRDTLQREGSDPVGKRLGFLLQEMLREANTTGSKANDAPMLADVVLIKEELERLREQVENLE
jgi:uncharacterized protein (TIGR00255 family)